MANARVSAGAIIVAGVMAGPVAGGQLVLLAKPFGGVLGVPGAVLGYIALTGLVVGCAGALLTLWRPVSMRVAGVCALVAGMSFAVAGLVSTPWTFVLAVVIGCAGAGPLLVEGRAIAFEHAGALVAWHLVTAAAVAGSAATASWCAERPGTGLTTAGVVAGALGVLALATEPIAVQQVSRSPGDPSGLPRGLLIGYAAVGVLLGGTVLPALHLLLFRWNALGTEQTNLLLLAALSALLLAVLPGPDPSALSLLLVLAAGGPILVATAPGRVTLVIGIAVTLAAATRAARALDSAVSASACSPARAASVTTPTVVIAGLAGLGLVVACGEFIGIGAGLTVLSIPALTGALLCIRCAPVPMTRSALSAPIFEAGAS